MIGYPSLKRSRKTEHEKEMPVALEKTPKIMERSARIRRLLVRCTVAGYSGPHSKEAAPGIQGLRTNIGTNEAIHNDIGSP